MASSTLADAIQALATAFADLTSELAEEAVIESPDLGLIAEEIIELPINIVHCAELAAEIFG